MSPPIYRVSRQILAVVVGTILTSSAFAFGQSPEGVAQPKPSKLPFNMVVVGDSILWGQGLKTEHKAWYQVKTWLEKNTGRTVIEKIEAHSGAVVEGRETIAIIEAVGEVNQASPTVSQQVDRALGHYTDGSKVDLVLVNGCANDIGLGTLLNAGLSEDQLRLLTEAKCGPPIERLLRKITSAFANAQVIVTGYYPSFSERTRNDFLIRAMARRFYKDNPGAPKMSSKVTLERLTANSKVWFESSNKSIAQAAANVNADLELKGSRPRVDFAQVHFLPEYSFAAADTRLWEFNRSPFKRLLVLISLGRIQPETNDERRKQRNLSCDEFYKRRASDTPDQKRELENWRRTCRYSALAHPNRKGAMVYAEAITNHLKSAIHEAGWIRKPFTPAAESKLLPVNKPAAAVTAIP